MILNISIGFTSYWNNLSLGFKVKVNLFEFRIYFNVMNKLKDIAFLS